MSPVLTTAEAARRLGLSPKALRLYEARGLVVPGRSAAGWRAYGPAEIARASEVATLRALGLSLTETARVLAGAPQALEPALALRQEALERQLRDLSAQAGRLRAWRAELARGEAPALAEMARLLGPARAPAARITLPWPWGGEAFDLPPLPPLGFLVGSLGSGKTRLARCIAAALPGAAFIGPERQPGPPTPQLRTALAWLREEGATDSPALRALLGTLLAEGPTALVVDMVEQGLDAASQEALMAWLRRRPAPARPLLLMTRSSAILDLAVLQPGETILFCPANHAPPFLVAPHPGAPGQESLADCLATPTVRARLEAGRGHERLI